MTYRTNGIFSHLNNSIRNLGISKKLQEDISPRMAEIVMCELEFVDDVPTISTARFRFFVLTTVTRTTAVTATAFMIVFRVLGRIFVNLVILVLSFFLYWRKSGFSICVGSDFE